MYETLISSSICALIPNLEQLQDKWAAFPSSFGTEDRGVLSPRTEKWARGGRSCAAQCPLLARSTQEKEHHIFLASCFGFAPLKIYDIWCFAFLTEPHFLTDLTGSWEESTKMRYVKWQGKNHSHPNIANISRGRPGPSTFYLLHLPQEPYNIASFPPWTDQETEALQGLVTCPRSFSC